MVKGAFIGIAIDLLSSSSPPPQPPPRAILYYIWQGIYQTLTDWHRGSSMNIYKPLTYFMKGDILKPQNP